MLEANQFVPESCLNEQQGFFFKIHIDGFDNHTHLS